MSSKNMGFILLPRSIMETELWNSGETGMYKLLTYCAMKANYKDTDYKGIRIKKGCFITSIHIISKEVKMSENSVRDKLRKLEEIGEIKFESSPKGTKIDVINYKGYQFDIDSATSEFEPPKPSTPSKFEPPKPSTPSKFEPPKPSTPSKFEPLSLQNLNPNKNIYKNNINSRAEHDTSSDEIKRIIDYLNKKANKNFKPGSNKTKRHITARLKEGYTFDDFKRVIDAKCSQWIDDPKMEKYLRPETLFGSKFEGYLNEKGKAPAHKNEFRLPDA